MGGKQWRFSEGLEIQTLWTDNFVVILIQKWRVTGQPLAAPDKGFTKPARGGGDWTLFSVAFSKVHKSPLASLVNQCHFVWGGVEIH